MKLNIKLQRLLAVLILLTPGRRNELIDYQIAKFQIAILPIMDVKTHWNLTLELLEQVYWFWELTCEWLRNLKYFDFRPLFTTQDELTIVKYVMKVLTPLRSWTLLMLTRHTVILHHIFTVYNDIFDQINGVIQALPKKKTQWMDDLFSSVKFVCQKLSEQYTDLTSMQAMLLILPYILHSFRK